MIFSPQFAAAIAEDSSILSVETISHEDFCQNRRNPLSLVSI